MRLREFEGERIFVDANIFVFHATDSEYTEFVVNFLERVEIREFEAYITPSVIDEASYILLINKGLELLQTNSMRKVRDRIESDNEFASECYSVVKDFLEYLNALGDNVKIMEVRKDDAFKIYEFGVEYQLHPKDALHLAVMFRLGLLDIATNDSDFERVEWIKVWKP